MDRGGRSLGCGPDHVELELPDEGEQVQHLDGPNSVERLEAGEDEQSGFRREVGLGGYSPSQGQSSLCVYMGSSIYLGLSGSL